MRGRRGCGEKTKKMKGEDNETEEDKERVVTLICKSVRGQVRTRTKQGHDRRKMKMMTDNKVRNLHTNPDVSSNNSQ